VKPDAVLVERIERIERCAAALRATWPGFTRRNLFHAVRREGALDDAVFDASLRRRLARGPLDGLLEARRRPTGPGAELAWGTTRPTAVLLVDRASVRDLLAPIGEELAVVCVDGTPARAIAWLARTFRAGDALPVLYVHDAATVVVPFALEPLASLVETDAQGLVYRDLGLPPLGAGARRFHDPTLPPDELVTELEQVPPASLARFCRDAARRVVRGARTEDLS
jgi:hypothetical protein